MRERTVHVTSRCNLRCPACERRDRPSAGAEAVRDAVRAAARERPETLFLSGGEPLLRRDVAALVALALSEGAGRVVLDTNGLLPADARVLGPVVAAGLGGARVFVPGGDDADWESFTGLPGGFARLRAGVANLRAAGVPLAFRHPVRPDSPESLRGVLAFAASLGPPSPPVLLDVRGAMPALSEAVAAAEALGVPLAVLPGSGPCPAGVPARSFPEPVAAVADGSGAGTVPAGDDVTTLVLYEEDDGRAETARLALTWRCDQRCTMCEVSSGAGAGAPSDGALAMAVEAAAERGVRRLVLTGGEPTLDPRLPDVVRRARAAGIERIELQTNAVRLAEPDRVAALAAAGLGRAFVSLHAADAATSDAITGAPGTHARTLAGIDALLAGGVEVDLNCVLSTANLDGLGTLVDLVAARWATRPHFGRIHFHTVRADPGASAATGPDGAGRARARPDWPRLVPPLSALGPALRDALERCHALGVPFTGPASTMGVPWCVLDGDPRYLGPLDGPGASRPHRAERPLFVRAAACDGCALADRCPGVRRDYVALHGSDGLRRL